MKIFIIAFGGQKSETIEKDFVPRIGDKIDLGYRPFPTVTNVLWFPKDVPTVDVILSVE